jgi:hypothetical protein
VRHASSSAAIESWGQGCTGLPSPGVKALEVVHAPDRWAKAPLSARVVPITGGN